MAIAFVANAFSGATRAADSGDDKFHDCSPQEQGQVPCHLQQFNVHYQANVNINIFNHLFGEKDRILMLISTPASLSKR